MEARAVAQGIKSGQDIKLLSQKAESLSGRTNSLINVLNLPWIKPVVNLAGLNFNAIAPEIRAAIDSTPYFLGTDQPRTYLLAFQNSAEARGTGGIIGAFAIITFDKGRMRIDKTGSNAVLASLNEIPIKMPKEYIDLYRSDPAIWQNSNLSPHFPYAALIYQALWKKQTGQTLDGVIAIDPSALSYLLKATGPITMPNGEIITSENVVRLTLKDFYEKYEDNNEARKQYLVEIVNSVFKHLNKKGFSKIRVAQGIRQAMLENRLLLFINDQKIENKFTENRLGGTLSDSNKNDYRAVIENIDASKLDYYLARTINLRPLTCGRAPTSELSIEVSNKVDAMAAQSLPAYVLTRADKGAPINRVPGQHRFKVFLYGPVNSQVISGWRSDDRSPRGGITTERKRPVVVFDVDLKPGASEKLGATFAGGVGPLTYHDQPLVITSQIKVSGQC